jgi:hypothetical protein
MGLDHAGQRFRHDQGNCPLFMLFDDFSQGGLHPIAGFAEHLAFGRANDLRLLLPLSVNLWLFSLYVFDQHPLPEAVVDISQGVDFFEFRAQSLGNCRGGLPDTLARAAVNRRNLELLDFADDPLNFASPLFIERNVERALDAPLLDRKSVV